MVKQSGKPLLDFVEAMDEVADELQAAYNDLNDKWLEQTWVASWI
jgi:hypothetical protein